MITLRWKAETTDTITLEWDPVPGAVGYRFQSASQPKWSHTFDSARTSVKFSKAASYKVEALGTKDAGEYPTAPTPPPPDPGNWTGPITITQGGTYNGSWESTSSAPAIFVNTTQPVTITGRARNLSSGPVIKCQNGVPVDVTVENLFAYGGSLGRFFESEGFKAIRLRSITLDKSRGIQLQWGVPGSSILIEKYRHINIQGNGTSPVGNFVQLREVQNASIEMRWIEVLNEYNISNPEDIVSCYKSANLRLHDFYFQHQSKPGNVKPSSQNPITIENGDGIPPRSRNNHVYDGWVIDCVGGVGIFGGDENTAERVRIIQDGKLPNGQQMANGYDSCYIAPGGVNNHIRNCVIGFVNSDGTLMPGNFTGAPQDKDTNTFLTKAQINEANEWTLWQQKLAANGITIGA